MLRRVPKRKTARRSQPANPVRALVPVDGTAIRQKLRKGYEKALRDLSQSREQLDHFQANDRPQFDRWLNSHFGALLTELRETRRQLAADEALIAAVENEAFLSGVSSAIAYELIMQYRSRLEKSPAGEDEAESRTDEDSAQAGCGSDGRNEKKDPFESFWDKIFAGLDPNEPDEPHNSGRAGWDQPGSQDRQRPSPGEPEVKAPRLKELYRALVRRLHPDRQQEMTPQKTEWWHQAQTAYQAGDADQLEVILTLCDIGDSGTTASTSASLLQRITAQLKASLRQIRQELARAKKDPAWNFSRRTDQAGLATETQRALSREQDMLRFKAQVYKNRITRWQAASDSLKKPRRRRRRTQDADCPF